MRSAESFFLSRRAFRFAALLLVLLFAAASAQAKNETPDPAANPALAALIKSGAKFFYMGRFAGLDGWLAVKDGQIQIVYKPTNNAFAVVGYLFAPNGDNVTAAQVKKLTATNKELAALASTADDLPSFLPADAAKTAAPNPDNSLPPGERLMKQLDRSPNVTIGANAAAPEISVVLSPGCPDCKVLWQAFRDPVEKGALRLRLFPAALNGSDDERAAARLLRADDPLAAFDKYMNGDKAALSGAPAAPALADVRANTALVDQWRFAADPMLIYRGKGGQVEIVQGTPRQPQQVLSDLAPPSGGGEAMNPLMRKLTSTSQRVAAKSRLPVKFEGKLPVLDRLRDLELTKGLPPATIVYGAAAGAIFALALYLMITGAWLSGLLTMLPAACFVGFAVHLMKHGQ